MSPRGSVRVVQGLTRAPDRLAWSGNTLFVLMPGERVAENEVARRVYSLSTSPGIVSGWEYIPADRPETLPTLAKQWGARDLNVVGFAATPAFPIVLLKRESGPYHLVALMPTGWVEASLPWTGDTPSVAGPAKVDRCHLITAGTTFGLLIERVGSSKSQWCTAADISTFRPPPVETSNENISLDWTIREIHFDSPTWPDDKIGTDTLCYLENQLIRVSVHGGSATISILGTSDEYPVTTIRGLGTTVRVAPVEGNSGFLALLSGAVPTGPESDAKPADSGYRLVEVTPSGRVLYDGPAKQGGPVSMREIQLLSVLLVIVMAAVIVFVLRPGAKTPPPLILPGGLAPADSGRRIMATIVDFGAAWVVTSMAVQIDFSDLVRPEILFASARGWIALGGALALSTVLGIFMEWQFGVTLGKMMLGCRVIAMPALPPVAAEGDSSATNTPVPPPQGPSFGASFVRNLAKLTPWNVVEFIAAGYPRHWADRVSKTVVVMLPTQEDPRDE